MTLETLVPLALGLIIGVQFVYILHLRSRELVRAPVQRPATPVRPTSGPPALDPARFHIKRIEGGLFTDEWHLTDRGAAARIVQERKNGYSGQLRLEGRIIKTWGPDPYPLAGGGPENEDS